MAIPLDQGVAALNIVEAPDDRLGHRRIAAVAEMPLQRADPQDQLGNGGGAGVHFESQQLVGVDSNALQLHEDLALVQRVERVEHLALDALEVLQGHVQKVAAAARRVQDADVDELAVEFPYSGDGLVGFAVTYQDQHGGAHGFPFSPDWVDDRGHHEAFDVLAGRVVGAELVALGQGPGRAQAACRRSPAPRPASRTWPPRPAAAADPG